ncbi:MAG: DUF3467 domain-containing protein, partial [Phototrophicaceae bacterium]
NPQNPQSPPNANRLRIDFPPDLNAEYANAAIINSTHSEIILDFLQILPNDPRGRVRARIAMTPANAKLLLRALQDRIAHFEKTQGEITLPQRPPSLADQLFNLGSENPDPNEPK